jgi:hypothetical protein
MISVLAAIASGAYAQQPPDSVVSDGAGNTAMGTGALISNGTTNVTMPLDPTAAYNTASGSAALYSNTTGSWNTATGYQALYSNTAGQKNTAFGFLALFANVGGSNNTAVGEFSLWSNTGDQNTALGGSTMVGNSTGSRNLAVGYQALSNYGNGNENSAIGFDALFTNTIGNGNTASGYQGLVYNTTGSYNTASGYQGLVFNTTGSYNIALGYQAGYNLITGSNNIDIGSPGGSSAENGTIRIGSVGTHTATYLAGITDSHLFGRLVFISKDGQLGVLGSSERYKTDITTMGSSTANLQQLRPVTFRLKDDPQGPVQYGLIAEEVAKVYPELVIRDGEGNIDGVRYEALAPMLLNEVQQQQKEIADQKASIAALAQQLRDMQQQLAEVKDLNQAKSSQVKLQATPEHADRL